MTKHGVASAVNITLLVGTAIGILMPAFVDNKSLTEIIVSLLKPELTQSYLMRLVILFFLMASLYNFVMELKYRKTPITLISTYIDIDFIKSDGSEVRIARRQLLRANQLNVTAYLMRASASSPAGRIPKERVTAQIYCDERQFDSSLRIFGKEGGQLKIFHLFGVPLPFSWYMCLLPAWVMNNDHEKLPHFFRKRIALREFSHVYEEEYNVENPSIAFSAETYPQKNVTIKVNFNGLNPKNIKVWRIKNNIVKDMSYKTENDGNIVKIFVKRLYGEEVMIMWNPPI